MSNQLKRISSKIIFAGGCLYTLIYLAAALTPYINPEYFYPATFLAIGFPIILAGMLLWVLIAFIFYRNKSRWVFLIVLLMGYKNIHAIFGWNVPKEFTVAKDTNTIRVLTWNVKDFSYNKMVDGQFVPSLPSITSFIKEMNADIVCIQDFTQLNGYGIISAYDSIRAKGYSYSVFNEDHRLEYPGLLNRYGTGIFSKYPIIDAGKVVYAGVNNESLSYITVAKGLDTFMVFNTHLRSMHINSTEPPKENYDFLKEDTAFLMHTQSKKAKLRYYDMKHIEQAFIIKDALKKAKYPYILCADLNSVPSSYVYHTINKNLNDAFVTSGSGLGATYDGLSPTLRIDVILSTKTLKPVQYYSPRLYISDHFPVVADLRFR